ncbi:MAG: hypothetical protein ACSHX6_16460 [Akkermansiaceae bacterium]
MKILEIVVAMIELVFLSPWLFVVAIALILRFVVLRKRFQADGWVGFSVFSVIALALPLAMGVWVPDFLGYTTSVARAETSSGVVIKVEQRWNYVDFYDTSVVVRYPDGHERQITLDGDDNKSWSVPMELDEDRRVAKITLSGGRYRSVGW